MPSSTHETPLRRLAEAVRRRRVELELKKIEVATGAGISVNTYVKIENGQSVRDVTYGKIESALGWAPGSCQEVLRGGQPTIAERLIGDAVVSPLISAQLETDVEQAVVNAAIAVTDSLSASEIRKLKHAVIEELRQAGHLPKSNS
ncbi:helix-turn-helix domain-containing protein [Streptomyces sp. MMS24-I29]|uniref:helix-turn-helix domain-containing protein n=1 Tax=Streptomyces sp. MMS24-I29 TaxID=3351480 RepID=UPI003C7E0F03